MSQKQTLRFKQQTSPPAGRKPLGTKTKFIGGIVALVIIVGALGIFALIHQLGSPTASNTLRISVSGSLQGSLTITTINACGTGQNLAGYEIDASGNIDATPYEFLLLIPQYQQPGTYSTTGSEANASISLTAISLGSQAWVSQGNTGSIVVNQNSHSGTFSTALISTANNAQAHITGTWACA